MENSNSISVFDILRQRLNMPDPWPLIEAPALSKRQIGTRRINRMDRIFRRALMRLGLSMAATAAKSYPFVDQGLE